MSDNISGKKRHALTIQVPGSKKSSQLVCDICREPVSSSYIEIHKKAHESIPNSKDIHKFKESIEALCKTPFKDVDDIPPFEACSDLSLLGTNSIPNDSNTFLCSFIDTPFSDEDMTRLLQPRF